MIPDSVDSANFSTSKWKVQEALDAQSDWGYCATKAKADREQRKIEARGQQATFIIVEDPVYCETKGE